MNCLNLLATYRIVVVLLLRVPPIVSRSFFAASSSRLSGSVARLLAVERTLPHCHSGKYDDNDVSFDNSLHHHEGGQATVKGVEKVLNADDNW